MSAPVVVRVRRGGRPRDVLHATRNPEMPGVFRIRKLRSLYGRQTEMMTIDGAKPGDIVEVLAAV